MFEINTMVTYSKGHTIFYVNFKCGFSTFEALREKNIVQRFFAKPKINDFIIIVARDPYKRLESFYRDKLIKNLTPEFKQHCQQNLLNFFGRDDLLLKKVSFEQFVKCLSKGYMDEHIVPQWKILPKEFDRIVKLEPGLLALQEILQVNPDNYTRNISTDTIVEFNWTREMRKIVNQIYAADFIILGYSMM